MYRDNSFIIAFLILIRAFKNIENANLGFVSYAIQ